MSLQNLAHRHLAFKIVLHLKHISNKYLKIINNNLGKNHFQKLVGANQQFCNRPILETPK